jgi:hypothetical protein
VRSVAEYLTKASEFENLAAAATVDVLRKRYDDIAACYRLLAKEREWLIGTGAIEGEPLINNRGGLQHEGKTSQSGSE